MQTREYRKPVLEYQEVYSNALDCDLSRHIIRYVFAVGKRFEKVSFKQSELVNCYFRNCHFVECDFTGATITASNFRGAKFDGCDFRYSVWTHTILEDDFLKKCLPSEENLARDLARSLRVNFTQIGNYQAVNQAASIEVGLTGLHLFNATYSRQSHYRKKHKGWDRVQNGLKHARWKALDLLWGNGESLVRILCSAVAFQTLGALALWYMESVSIVTALGLTAQSFWGVGDTSSLPAAFAILLTAGRYLLLGLFMTVLVKRLSRR